MWNKLNLMLKGSMLLSKVWDLINRFNENKYNRRNYPLWTSPFF